MFGLIKEKPAWQFGVFGKHPAAGDYLSLGSRTPLLTGFSSWMDKGYERIPQEDRDRQGLIWAFWARGPNAKLICGVLASSRDKHGRPYPLMIAGEGRIPESVKDWDMIPLACEATWRDLFLLGQDEAGNVKTLKRHVGRINGPEPPWTLYRERRDAVKHLEIPPVSSGTISDFMNKMNNVDGLSRKKRFFLNIDVGRPGDWLALLTKFLILLKGRSKTGPGTAFLEVGDRKKRLYLLNDSLVTDDFTALWNGCNRENDA